MATRAKRDGHHLGVPERSPEPLRKRTREQVTPVQSRGRRQRPQSVNSADYDMERTQYKRDNAKLAYEKRLKTGGTVPAAKMLNQDSGQHEDVLEFTYVPPESFVCVLTDPKMLQRKGYALPAGPLGASMVLIANAIALETLVCDAAEECELDRDLMQLVQGAVLQGLNQKQDSTDRLRLTNCGNKDSLVQQRASYLAEGHIRAGINTIISSGWQQAQDMSKLMCSAPLNTDMLLCEALCAARAPQGLSLACNRGRDNNCQFLPEAILERHKAQYRAARPEPHYLFAKTTLARTLLVVDGLDTSLPEISRQQASGASCDRHDKQIHHHQWSLTMEYVTIIALAGDEGTRHGTPGSSFLGTALIGMIKGSAPAPYHAYTEFRRYRCCHEAIFLGSGGGSGKKTAANIGPLYCASVIIPLPNYPAYFLGDDAGANPKAVRETMRVEVPLLVHLNCQCHRCANGLKHAMDNISLPLGRSSLAHSKNK
jgi:hypothetical protein